MTDLKTVIKVELKTSVIETVSKSTRHDYARGGYALEETIQRRTEVTPTALLECGHWRDELHVGTMVSGAKRLACPVCARAARLSAARLPRS